MSASGAHARRVIPRVTGFVVFCAVSQVQGYPEFQREIQTSSHRVVSCAMCHAHPDGPDGVKHGQIGSLGQDETTRLNQSRSMLEPGPVVDSPILNSFGDYLVSDLGRKRLMYYRLHPAELAAAFDQKHDLDGDGIGDARELRDGTDPTDARHGDPGLLFVANLRRHWFHLVMLAAATMLGLFGLSRLFDWFAIEARRAVENDKTPTRKRSHDC
ncbi:MAG: thrombospondin type 3 repeat-containing protein [Myxococcales bacterium]